VKSVVVFHICGVLVFLRIANDYIQCGRILGRAKRHPAGMPSSKSDRAGTERVVTLGSVTYYFGASPTKRFFFLFFLFFPVF